MNAHRVSFLVIGILALFGRTAASLVNLVLLVVPVLLMRVASLP